MKLANECVMIVLLGFDTVQVMAVEASADLFEQLGGGLQINMSGTDIYMPHIGGQPR